LRGRENIEADSSTDIGAAMQKVVDNYFRVARESRMCNDIEPTCKRVPDIWLRKSIWANCRVNAKRLGSQGQRRSSVNGAEWGGGPVMGAG
jgi:hypothetical protein